MPSPLMHRFRFKNLLEFFLYAQARPWTKAAERLSERRRKHLRKRGGRLKLVTRRGLERPMDRARNRKPRPR